jgi:intracellular septation protein
MTEANQPAAAAAGPRGPQWLHYAVDGAPAVAFLGVLLITHDFRLATWFVVGGAVLSLVVSLIVERRLRPLPTFTGVLALVFGAASLILHRSDILKMKLTIIDGLLGAILLGGLALKKNPLKMILGGSFHLSDRAWAVLAVRYGLFWWACAIANEVVRRTQSDVVWGYFRVAVIVVAVIFALAQTPFLLKHNQPPEAAGVPEPPDPGF